MALTRRRGSKRRVAFLAVAVCSLAASACVDDDDRSVTGRFDGTEGCPVVRIEGGARSALRLPEGYETVDEPFRLVNRGRVLAGRHDRITVTAGRTAARPPRNCPRSVRSALQVVRISS